MVYKVVGDFNNENFGGFVDKLAKNFKILYKNETLYLSLISIETFSEIEDCDRVVKNTFKPQKSFLVRKLTKNLIEKEPKEVREWLVNNCVELDKQLYKKNEQDKLQEMWKILDKLEEEIDDKINSGDIKPKNLNLMSKEN